jgi:hypothetical protein
MTKYFALCVLLGAFASAQAAEDPLRASVQIQDAQRFATLFLANKLSASELQAGYLDGAGRGVEIFTPQRIHNSANLAQQVNKRKSDYAHAIATCLPLAEGLNAELRAIYLAYRGLLPDFPLPRVYLVFGAGNSGGTAQRDAQVLALEVLCKEGTTPEQFHTTMRKFFAHETVHTWQKAPTGVVKDRLLLSALLEGVPDLLSELVTGLEPDHARESWARPKESDIWRRFTEDRLTLQTGDEKQSQAAFGRWFANAGLAIDGVPDGWPGELGYWVGRNIARAYLAKAVNKRDALLTLIAAEDPIVILRASGYAPR